MDAKLKAKLTRFAETTLRDLKVDGLEVTLEMMVRKTQLPVAKNARILAAQDMRRRVQNARLWQGTSEEMALEWMADFMTDILRKEKEATSKIELSAARERQLALFPGFESLPTRFRSGRTFLKFSEATVPQFLSYETTYQARAQRNQQTADELRRLAKTLEPFSQTDLTVAAAFERIRTQPVPRCLCCLRPRPRDLMPKRKDPAAVSLGRRGGRAHVPKGFALIDPERKREIQRMGGRASAKARRRHQTN